MLYASNRGVIYKYYSSLTANYIFNGWFPIGMSFDIRKAFKPLDGKLLTNKNTRKLLENIIATNLHKLDPEFDLHDLFEYARAVGCLKYDVKGRGVRVDVKGRSYDHDVYRGANFFRENIGYP